MPISLSKTQAKARNAAPWENAITPSNGPFSFSAFLNASKLSSNPFFSWSTTFFSHHPRPSKKQVFRLRLKILNSSVWLHYGGVKNVMNNFQSTLITTWSKSLYFTLKYLNIFRWNFNYFQLNQWFHNNGGPDHFLSMCGMLLVTKV